MIFFGTGLLFPVMLNTGKTAISFIKYRYAAQPVLPGKTAAGCFANRFWIS